MGRGALPACTVAALVGCSAIAHAQGGSKAMAEALFQDGRELLEAGKTHEACEKFALSQRIEPKLGTLLNLASCHEAEGKTASAWAEFMEAWTQATRANQAEREAFAREHADALLSKLSRVSVVTSEHGPLSVRIDGVAVDRDALGTAFPVDPGDHLLEVTAPGKRDWTVRFKVVDGVGLLALSVPALIPEAEGPPRGGVGGASPGRAAPPADRVATPVPTASPSTHTGGWIALGAGAIALGTGTFFGLRALSLEDDAEQRCPEVECDQAGLDRFQDAETSATASTVAFGTGLFAVGLGIYLLTRPVAAKAAASRVARITPRGGGIGVAW